MTPSPQPPDTPASVPTSTPPATPTHPRANRLGLWLFAGYLLVYAAFVWLAAFSGATLATKPFGGVNLAIVAGFFLIVSPLVLSVIYLRWAGKAED